MHDNWALSVYCRSRTSTCQASSGSSPWLASISIACLAGPSPLEIKLDFGPSDGIFKFDLHLFFYVLAFFSSDWASGISIMIDSTFILENIVVKLIERILIESRSSTGIFGFIIELSSFILIHQCFVCSSIISMVLFAGYKLFSSHRVRIFIGMIFMCNLSKCLFDIFFCGIRS